MSARGGRAVRRIMVPLLIFLLIFACVMGIAYFLEIYRVDPAKIYVDGNTHYSNQEIIDTVMTGPLGDNSIVLSMKYKNRKITDVPFVDAITVEVVSSDSIRIRVFEKALAGYVKYLDRYIYFDKDGTVVESSDVLTKGIPQVTGINFSGIQVGKPLTTDDTDIFLRTLDLTKLLAKYELSADRIHFHGNGEVTIYFGNIRVDLGTDEQGIEDKVMLLGKFLERVESLSGVLDMEEYNEEGIYVFKPDTDG